MDQAEKLRSLSRTKETRPELNHARVFTITSGKGGVGKTNFSVNLALFFAKQGKKVIIIDTDIGLANIEILLGSSPKYNLFDLFSQDGISIEDIINTTKYGVSFISGGSGLNRMPELGHNQINHIIENLSKLDYIADVIIIDTGAGISELVLNFIKASSETIIVTVPEPTSITDAYSLMKALKNDNLGSLPEFKLVVNRVDSRAEGEAIYRSFSKVAEGFLDVKIELLGSILYDNNLIKSVKSQKPAFNIYPNSNFSKEIESIGLKLLNIKEAKGMQNFIKSFASIFRK